MAYSTRDDTFRFDVSSLADSLATASQKRASLAPRLSLKRTLSSPSEFPSTDGHLASDEGRVRKKRIVSEFKNARVTNASEDTGSKEGRRTIFLKYGGRPLVNLVSDCAFRAVDVNSAAPSADDTIKDKNVPAPSPFSSFPSSCYTTPPTVPSENSTTPVVSKAGSASLRIANLSIRGQTPGQESHVYVQTAGNLLANDPETVYVEDLAPSNSSLAAMLEQYHCPFAHVALSITLPSSHQTVEGHTISAELELLCDPMAHTKCMTSIYRDGTLLSCTVELLTEFRLGFGAGDLCHVPLAPGFWKSILQANGTGTNNPLERISIIQQFTQNVVMLPSSLLSSTGMHFAEKVALIIVYDVSSRETNTSGCATISRLSSRKNSMPSPEEPELDAMKTPQKPKVALGQLIADKTPTPSPTKSQRAKPNLSVDIPPIPLNLGRGRNSNNDNGSPAPGSARPLSTKPPLFADQLARSAASDDSDLPITPLDQVIHTPLYPPEIPRTVDASTRRRVETLWAPTPTESTFMPFFAFDQEKQSPSVFGGPMASGKKNAGNGGEAYGDMNRMTRDAFGTAKAGNEVAAGNTWEASGSGSSGWPLLSPYHAPAQWAADNSASRNPFN